jgi:hypothetical protein
MLVSILALGGQGCGAADVWASSLERHGVWGLPFGRALLVLTYKINGSLRVRWTSTLRFSSRRGGDRRPSLDRSHALRWAAGSVRQGAGGAPGGPRSVEAPTRKLLPDPGDGDGDHRATYTVRRDTAEAYGPCHAHALCRSWVPAGCPVAAAAKCRSGIAAASL